VKLKCGQPIRDDKILLGVLDEGFFLSSLEMDLSRFEIENSRFEMELSSFEIEIYFVFKSYSTFTEVGGTSLPTNGLVDNSVCQSLPYI